jgi:hypothetical protein
MEHIWNEPSQEQPLWSILQGMTLRTLFHIPLMGSCFGRRKIDIAKLGWLSVVMEELLVMTDARLSEKVSSGSVYADCAVPELVVPIVDTDSRPLGFGEVLEGFANIAFVKIPGLDLDLMDLRVSCAFFSASKGVERSCIWVVVVGWVVLGDFVLII